MIIHRGRVVKTGKGRWTWGCQVDLCGAGATYLYWHLALQAAHTHARNPLWR